MIFTPYNELIQAIPILELPDDASESSTFAVRLANARKAMLATKSTKKSVGFDESKNTVYKSESGKNDWAERWYTAYDIQNFRSQNSFALKQLHRESLSTSENVLSTKAVIDHTYCACQGMLFDDIEVLCPEETEQLYDALRDPIYPTGLASYTSSTIRRDVRARRSKVVEVVKAIQRTVGGAQDDATAEYIRKSSENISRPSRIFAQLIAQTEACF